MKFSEYIEIFLFVLNTITSGELNIKTIKKVIKKYLDAILYFFAFISQRPLKTEIKKWIIYPTCKIHFGNLIPIKPTLAEPGVCMKIWFIRVQEFIALIRFRTGGWE